MGTGASTKKRHDINGTSTKGNATQGLIKTLTVNLQDADKDDSIVLGLASGRRTCSHSPRIKLGEGCYQKLHQDLSPAELLEARGAIVNMKTAPSRVPGVDQQQAYYEMAVLDEFKAGSEISGERCWSSGRCIILSGEARVLATVEQADVPHDTEIARLRQYDTFGWSPDVEEYQEDADLWDSLYPRVIVSGSENLRVCRLPFEPVVFSRVVSKASTRAQSKAATPCDSVSVGVGDNFFRKRTVHMERHGADHTEPFTLSDRLVDLWHTSSASESGLCEQVSGLLRSHFLAEMWAPLLSRMEEQQDIIRHRKAMGLRTHDCFPLQGRQIVELRNYTLRATEVWYGSIRGGNLSALYKWFIDSMNMLGVVAYSYETIPRERSADGWAAIVDGAARAAALKGKSGLDARYVAAGGAVQRQGKSAIDNTVLRNVFLPSEGRELLIGRRIRKILCRLLVIRQVCILRKLSNFLHLDLLSRTTSTASKRSQCAVRSVLQALRASDLQHMGLDPQSFCWRLLSSRGTVVDGFGQLAPDDQQMVWQAARTLLNNGVTPDQVPPQADSPDLYERFVAWARDHPGQYFEHNKDLHVTTQLSGIFAEKLFLVKRSAMERLTLARYFSITWTRCAPLWGVFNHGHQVEVRSAGTLETSNLRVNECPYASMHGMSLPGGGFAADHKDETLSQKASTQNLDCLSKTFEMKKNLRNQYSLMMEMQWVRDPSANIQNWFLTDIEKIVAEAWQLNPHGAAEFMLPCEMFIMVGQNPKVGSSIRHTQHTQLCEGSLRTYPVLQLVSNPWFSSKVGATVDIVDVGPTDASVDEKGFFVKICTRQPTRPEIIKCLVDLRLLLLTTFGGAELIDFLVLALSDEAGGFVIIFAPLPQLEKISDDHPDLATWANPLTGESSCTAGLEETRIDFGKGVGHFLCAKPALREQVMCGGEDMLRRIWAFNRVPGARAATENFLRREGVAL